mgnify:CR=1 FL=1
MGFLVKDGCVRRMMIYSEKEKKKLYLRQIGIRAQY